MYAHTYIRERMVRRWALLIALFAGWAQGYAASSVALSRTSGNGGGLVTAKAAVAGDLLAPGAFPINDKPPFEARPDRYERVKVSTAMLTQLAFNVRLPGGQSVTVVQDEAENRGAGNVTWIGHIDGEPLSRVTFALQKGVVAGVVDRPLLTGNELYDLLPSPGADYRWFQHDETKLPPCAHSATRPVGKSPDTGGTAVQSPPATAADPVVIDVLVVYTPASRVRYGQSGIEAKIVQAVADANTGFANSLVNIQYQLVYYGEVAYVETGDMNTTLSALYSPVDGAMDSVHSLRDLYGADLVCLMDEDTSSCGLGYVMQTVSTSFASSAFSVVYSGCLTSLSFGHELAHNAGCQHDRANAAFQGAYPYAYGYRRCSGDSTAFRTVMSYACTTSSPRINYFSNPDLVYLGNPLGIDYLVDPANSADNATALNQTATVVAGFKPTSSTQFFTVPSAPSGLIATAVDYNWVNLDWSDNASNENGYSVERSLDGITWSVLSSLAAGVVTYDDTTVVASTTYSYRVRAQNSAGSSSYSNVATVTTPAGMPAAPSGLAAVAASASQINLSWVDNASNETAYSVERSTDGVTYAVAATLGAGVTSYSDTARAASTLCYYRVRAQNTAGWSSYSAVASARTYPAAPSGLTATAASSSQINLAWVDNASDETAYAVERSIDGVNFTALATLGANSVAYSNTGLTAGSTFYYRVRAQSSVGWSGYSAVASATTSSSAPAAPTGLTATAVSTSQINLAWVDNATTETAYSVERSTDGTTFTVLATLAANVVSYSDTGRTANTKYYYRVRAAAGTVYSAYSAVASATTLTTPPAAPTGLKATVKSSSQIDLAWTDAATNESNYYVEQSADGVNFTLVATLAANSKAYSSTGLTAATKYYYRVRAGNSGGYSAYSAIVNATTSVALPAAPTSLAATVVSKSQINLTWIDNSTNETGFKVERSTNGTKWTQIASVGAGVTTYSNTALTANTTYYYRVCAYNAGGNSAYTATVTAKTLAQ